MRPPATPVPVDALELVSEINAIRAGFWNHLRELNANDAAGGPRTTGADIDGLFERDNRKKALEDELRRRYFRRAARVTVDQWGVYTWSPTGRIVRQVWTIEQPHTPRE